MRFLPVLLLVLPTLCSGAFIPTPRHIGDGQRRATAIDHPGGPDVVTDANMVEYLRRDDGGAQTDATNIEYGLRDNGVIHLDATAIEYGRRDNGVIHMEATAIEYGLRDLGEAETDATAIEYGLIARDAGTVLRRDSGAVFQKRMTPEGPGPISVDYSDADENPRKKKRETAPILIGGLLLD
ncbi:hypothetical protein DL96DRAFT_1580198 [Flagelloscypha sp. PMI_526]|nr:hypothetical protein DL96DRAFT_1580198 [Flagelloscypha sp. PMI_526]